MDRAEWILSLVLPGDRAVSVIGDFVEEVAARGSFWFWISVIRTLLASLWNDFAESPISLLVLALRGCLSSALASFSGLFALLVAMVPSYIIFGIFDVTKTPVPEWLVVASVVVNCIAGLGLQFICQFQVGRSVGRRAPGHEVAAGVGLCLVEPLAANCLGALIHSIPAYLLSYPHFDLHPSMLVVIVCRVGWIAAICSGAVVARREFAGVRTA